MPAVDRSEGGMEVVILDVDSWGKRSSVNDVGPIVDSWSCWNIIDEPEDRERGVLSDLWIEAEVDFDASCFLAMNVVDAGGRRLTNALPIRTPVDAPPDRRVRVPGTRDVPLVLSTPSGRASPS
jgi:hypothetical protein